MGVPYKKVAFQTLGCKLNFTETSTIAQDFISNGYARVNFNEPADVYVINTCSVTENANKKARKAIRYAHRISPNSQIAVIGCYAQLKPKEIKEISGVCMIVGTEEKFNLVEKIESRFLNKENNIVLNSNINITSKFHPAYSNDERIRCFLKIQDGCDYNCSFCTIPLARGKSRSANIDETLKQAYEISKNNIKEIVLTGVNIGDFGVQHNETLLELIIELDKIAGIERYRISSIEPNLLSDEIIKFVSCSPKFLPHFHVPLQSGSDKVLKNMRRRYNIDYYKGRMTKIKSLIPDASIGIDVIVGFPGETEERFQETFGFLKKTDFSYLHVFPYSKRENTDAINKDDHIDKNIISSRVKKLNYLSQVKKKNFYKNNFGNVREVLFEQFIDGCLIGYTDNYIPVKIVGSSDEINNIIPIKLNSFYDDLVLGERQC